MVQKIKNLTYTDWMDGLTHTYEQTVIEQYEEHFVCYQNEDGEQFRVIFKQKKYPIGFMAKW